MNKYILSFLLLMLSFGESFGQDLIVTATGDSIECEIIRVNNVELKYRVHAEDALKRDFILQSNIRTYQLGFFSGEDQAVLNSAGLVKRPKAEGIAGKDWRFAFTAGAAQRTAQPVSGLTASFDDHLRKLRTGFQLSADINRYFSPSIGLGVKYSLFQSSNEDVISVNVASGTETGLVDETIRMQFYGLHLAVRNISANGRNAFFLNIGGGYMTFYDELQTAGLSTLKSGVPAVFADIGYDFALTDRFSIGIQGSIYAGNMKKVELTQDGRTQTIKAPDGQKEALTRLEIGVGLRYVL